MKRFFYKIALAATMATSALNADTFTFNTIDNQTVSVTYENGIIFAKVNGNPTEMTIDLFGTTCPPCIAKIPELNREYQDGHMVVGIDTFYTDDAGLYNFKQNYDVKFPVTSSYQEGAQKLMNLLKEKGVFQSVVPTTFEIGPNGTYL